jgi:hypothetical protein
MVQNACAIWDEPIKKACHQQNKYDPIYLPIYLAYVR